MSEIRRELRLDTQTAYGNYCNLCKQNLKTPITYHEFSDMFVTGKTIKLIFKEEPHATPQTKNAHP